MDGTVGNPVMPHGRNIDFSLEWYDDASYVSVGYLTVRCQPDLG